MTRVELLPADANPALKDTMQVYQKYLGYVPNSKLIMQHRPKLMKALAQMASAVWDKEASQSRGIVIMRSVPRERIRTVGWLGGFVMLAAAQAWGQAPWRPDRATELIITTAPGGSNDLVARLMQRVLQDGKVLATPVVVVNKPGGNQTLALAYLNQHPADAHYLLMGNPTVITNPLSGITPMTVADLTPVAMLLVEHTAITVRADSPIRNLRDLAERLKADPESMVLGTAARGGVNHLAFVLALKAGGVDVKKTKTVVFKTNGESIAAMMGGHIHMVSSSVNAARPQVTAGNIRAIAVAAQQRMAGAFSDAATFREQGIDNWVSSWRGMFAPKGTGPAPVAFWESALGKMAASDEWNKQLAANEWHPQFLRSAEFTKYLEVQHNANRAIMADVGLVK